MWVRVMFMFMHSEPLVVPYRQGRGSWTLTTNQARVHNVSIGFALMFWSFLPVTVANEMGTEVCKCVLVFWRQCVGFLLGGEERSWFVACSIVRCGVAFAMWLFIQYSVPSRRRMVWVARIVLVCLPTSKHLTRFEIDIRLSCAQLLWSCWIIYKHDYIE